MILVIGATGNVGGHLVQQLCREGVPTRALVRSPEKADVLRGYDCHAVVGDYDRPASLDAALEGVDRVFLVTPAGPRMAEQETAVLDAVRRKGGARVVKLAMIGVDRPDPSLRLQQAHRSVVDALADLPHTVLAPNGFFQTFLRSAGPVQERRQLPSLAGDAAVSYVDAADVAAVAAHVLTSDGHDGATYTVTGPQALTYAQVAEALSRRLAEPVQVVDVDPDGFRAGATGADPWLVDGLVELSGFYRSGAASAVTDEVQKATGRAPRSVDDFLDDHLAAFR